MEWPGLATSIGLTRTPPADGQAIGHGRDRWLPQRLCVMNGRIRDPAKVRKNVDANRFEAMG